MRILAASLFLLGGKGGILGVYKGNYVVVSLNKGTPI